MSLWVPVSARAIMTGKTSHHHSSVAFGSDSNGLNGPLMRVESGKWTGFSDGMFVWDVVMGC